MQTLVKRLLVYHTRLKENLRALREISLTLFEEQEIERPTPKPEPEVTEGTEHPIETTPPSAPNNTAGDEQQATAQ